MRKIKMRYPEEEDIKNSYKDDKKKYTQKSIESYAYEDKEAG